MQRLNLSYTRFFVLVSVLVSLLAGCYQDDFSQSGYLEPGYRWVDDGKDDTYTISGGRLKITASRGEDLWGGLPVKRGAPLMLRTPPPGDYLIESDVDAHFAVNVGQYINTQTGLFVFQDEENWLFFGFTNHSSQGGALAQGNGLIVTRTIGDSSTIRWYEPFAPDIARLKIEKQGNYWRFYRSLGGGNWGQVGPIVQAGLGNHEVGVGVKSFLYGGAAGRGTFDNLRIWAPPEGP